MKPEDAKQTITPRFINLLGGQQIIKKDITSDFDLVTLCEEGIPIASLAILSKYMGISENDFLDTILHKHYSSQNNFDKYTSSYILEIAKVVEHAYEVLKMNKK